MSLRRVRPLSPDVADLLRAEQRAPAPSPARQAAIWARLEGAAATAAAATAAASLGTVGGGAAAASTGTIGATVAGSPASATSSLGAAVSATAAAGAAAVPASKSLLVIVLLAATGVGVGAGTAVVGRAAKSKSEPRPATKPATTVAAAAQDGARTSGTAEREWSNGAQTASEAGSRLEKSSPAGQPPRRARDGSDVAGGAAAPGRITRVPRPPVFPAAEAPAQLAEEAHLLHGAHAALAAGDAQGALAGVLRHARHHPAGLLAEEREALHVRALLVLGHHTEAIARGRDFIRRYPGSVQRPAVERALAEIR